MDGTRISVAVFNFDERTDASFATELGSWVGAETDTGLLTCA